MVGFKFAETMAGTLHRGDGAGKSPSEVPFSFRIDARCRTLTRYLQGAPMEIAGSVSIPGIAAERPLSGTLDIGLPLRRELVYAFSFVGDDGATYRFYGRKDVRYTNLLVTMTTLRGELFRNGETVGNATIYFDLKDLPSFLASWRPTFRSA